MTQIKASLIDHMGSDLSVVNAARVSFGKESKMICTDQKVGTYDLAEGDKRLISYLAKHKHTSPFGHAFASFHVKAPIFVARQLVKHKFLRWNEISGRYVEFGRDLETKENLPVADVFYIPDSWREASKDKKQGSGKHLYDEDFVGALGASAHALAFYYDLLDSGVCPEQARMVLPQNTMTEWWWSGSLDAFADMCKLRLKEDTQYETRLVAIDVDREMRKLFPHSWEALVS